MSNHSYPKLFPLGDSALTIEFGASINPRVNGQVHALAQALATHPIPGVLDVVPAFASLTVFYDPTRLRVSDSSMLPLEALELEVRRRFSPLAHSLPARGRDVDLPVCYGGEFGPDLEELARFHGLTQQQLIDLHTEPAYSVYMLGFAPGFPYLGGLHRKLHTPRRSSPRAQVPAGSVGIGGAQTGVYSLATPGGWNIIGRTPLALFRPDNDVPSLLRPGDRLRFRPVGAEEFNALVSGRRS
jgi:inhibitor of KinA